MNRKAIEVVAAILVIVALIVVLVLIFSGEKQVDTNKSDTPVTERPVDTSFPQEAVNTDNPVIIPQPYVRTWVERFGSFSSESGYKNIQDVLPLSTTALRQELTGLLARLESQAGGYYGISTRVVHMETVSESEEEVVIRAQTQRVETIDDPTDAETRYQDIDVTLVREGDHWLVSDYVWE